MDNTCTWSAMPAVLLEILDAGHDDDLAYIVAHVRSLADAVRLVGTACSRFRAVAHRRTSCCAARGCFTTAWPSRKFFFHRDAKPDALCREQSSRAICYALMNGCLPAAAVPNSANQSMWLCVVW